MNERKTKYGKKIRNIIEANKNLSKIIDFNSTDIFERRTTYVAIIILSKQPNQKIDYVNILDTPLKITTIFENDIKLDTNIIPYNFIINNGWNVEHFELQKLKSKLINKYGTIKDDYIIGQNGFGDVVKGEKEITRPIIYNEEFYSFKKIEPSAYCIFPYKGEKNKEKISISEIKERYPMAFMYLKNNEKLIKENQEYRKSDEYWHTFTREHNHELYSVDKIVIPMTAKDTFATYNLIDKNIKDMDIYTLVNIFELLLSKEQVKEFGAIYTPQQIKEFIINKLIEKDGINENTTFLDPACGCGSILISLAEIMNRRYKISYKNIFENMLFGIDIDKDSIFKAELLSRVLAITNNEIILLWICII